MSNQETLPQLLEEQRAIWLKVETARLDARLLDLAGELEASQAKAQKADEYYRDLVAVARRMEELRHGS